MLSESTAARTLFVCQLVALICLAAANSTVAPADTGVPVPRTPAPPHTDPVHEDAARCLRYSLKLTVPGINTVSAVIDHRGCYSSLGLSVSSEPLTSTQPWIRLQEDPPEGATFPPMPSTRALPEYLQLPYVNYSSNKQTGWGMPLAGSRALGGQEFLRFYEQCAASCLLNEDQPLEDSNFVAYFMIQKGVCKCFRRTQLPSHNLMNDCCGMAYPNGSSSFGPNSQTPGMHDTWFPANNWCDLTNRYAVVYEADAYCWGNETTCNSRNGRCEFKNGCCIPKGADEDPYPLFQVTMVHWMITFFVIMIVCQMVWWVMRFRLRHMDQWDPAQTGGQNGVLQSPDLRRTKVEAEAAAKQVMELFHHHPAVKEGEPIPEDDDGACTLCLDDLAGQVYVKLSCGHKLHAACVEEFLGFALKSATKAPQCPNCRADVLHQRELKPEEVPIVADLIDTRERLRAEARSGESRDSGNREAPDGDPAAEAELSPRERLERGEDIDVPKNVVFVASGNLGHLAIEAAEATDHHRSAPASPNGGANSDDPLLGEPPAEGVNATPPPQPATRAAAPSASPSPPPPPPPTAERSARHGAIPSSSVSLVTPPRRATRRLADDFEDIEEMMEVRGSPQPQQSSAAAAAAPAAVREPEPDEAPVDAAASGATRAASRSQRRKMSAQRQQQQQQAGHARQPTDASGSSELDELALLIGPAVPRAAAAAPPAPAPAPSQSLSMSLDFGQPVPAGAAPRPTPQQQPTAASTPPPADAASVASPPPRPQDDKYMEDL